MSVVVPVFNGERTVHRAVESILRQRGVDLEVLVVDDGSTDGTLREVRGVSDPRVRAIPMDVNAGACVARNAGLRDAVGEWVTFADSDDWMERERLSELLQVAADAYADVVADDLYWTPHTARPGPDGGAVGPDGSPLALSSLFSPSLRATLPRAMGAAEFVAGNLPGRRRLNLGLIKPLFRRAFLAEHQLVWDESVRYGQDTAFYTDVLAAGARCVLSPYVGYYYVTNPTGISKRAPALDAVAHRLEVNERLRQRHSEDVQLARALAIRSSALRRELAAVRFRQDRTRRGTLQSAAKWPLGAFYAASDSFASRMSHYGSRLRDDGLAALIQSVRRRTLPN